MLNVSNVHTGYGPIPILKGVSMEIREGEVVALIGANGAGKTTALLTLSGVLFPRSGRVTYLGADITGEPTHRIAGMGISHVPEGRRIFSRLTVLENLELGGYVLNDRKKVRKCLEQVYHFFPVLRERGSQYGGTLSGGEQQMLALGRALMFDPKLLLLDEPSLGLAPVMVEKIFEIILEMNRSGRTILLVEQNAHGALQLAHRGYVMETGEIVIEGTGESLLNDSRVKQAYLGMTETTV